MKFCQNHWDMLKKAIEDKGMMPLVAANSQVVAENIKAELEGISDLANFDPLMSCHNMIAANAIERGGLYLLTGNYCPLCELNKGGGDAKEWIENSTESCLLFCRENKLVPMVQ